MGDAMHVLFVSECPRRRASVERALPGYEPVDVTGVSDATSALDVCSERTVDCVAVEHAVGDAIADAGTDALDAVATVRDSNPAVPVVILERAGASPVASDAISLGVSEYVCWAEADDPLAALARECHDAASAYRAERDVAMLNDLARTVYERVTDGFFALDREWRFTYLNDAAEEILGASTEDVVGEKFWDAFPVAAGTDFFAEYRRAMEAQEQVTFREHYPPLGKTFEVRAFPSRDGLSVHFREVLEDDDRARQSDHLRELTEVLSSDLMESIDAVRGDLEDARTTADDTDAIEAALDDVDRMESLVDASIRLTNDHPTPDGSPSE